MFNKMERTRNIIRISIVSALASVISILVQFLYRTIFLTVLSKEYLGIEGLFSNVIQVLSLADLGIGVAISYKLYIPIQSNDVKTVAGIMIFYRKIYRVISIVVLTIGIILVPFLKMLVKDADAIPKDINFYAVYILFLTQSFSSYFFSYKQALLSADQKGDVLALYTASTAILKSIVQIITIKITKNYQLMLGITIVISITINWLFSIYITKKYAMVFRKHTKIENEVKKEIYYDIKSTLCHKIGGTILGATDNIILSAFVGLSQLGIYSNYSLIVASISKILNQLLGNFTASLGNAYISLNKEDLFKLYERLLIINFIFTNIATGCIYILINPFISVWQNSSMIFETEVIAVIALCFFFNTIRIINTSFTNACGLFAKDIVRPLIEVIINLGTSIYFTLKLGMIGVFLGTILSHICTVWWREPYLLHKYVFQRSMVRYWFLYLKNIFIVICENAIIKKFFLINISNIWEWIFQAIITFIIVAIINLMIYWKSLGWIWEKRIRKNN